MHCTTPALIHERTVDMGFILQALGHVVPGGAGIAGIGDDFWGVFYNGFTWYWNFYCQWGC